MSTRGKQGSSFHVPPAPPRRRWWETGWARTIEIVTVVGGFVGILAYFGIAPTPTVAPAPGPRLYEIGQAPGPIFVQPPKALQKNPDGSARQFTQITDADYQRLFVGKTGLQIESSVQDYYGDKWVALSVTVLDVAPSIENKTIVLVDGWKLPGSGPAVTFDFDSKWKDQVEYLHESDSLKAVCQIHASSGTLSFEHCERFDR